MNISLTAELENYVRRKVASGLYNNASEVVREALRALLKREEVASEVAVRAPAKTDVLKRLGSLEKPLRERGVKALAVFGSVARGTARFDSDVDILVDVDPGARFSLVDLAALTVFLEDHLERKVDLVTEVGLDPDIRDRVLAEAKRVY